MLHVEIVTLYQRPRSQAMFFVKSLLAYNFAASDGIMMKLSMGCSSYQDSMFCTKMTLSKRKVAANCVFP